MTVFTTHEYTFVPVRIVPLTDFQVQRGNLCIASNGRTEVAKTFQGENAAGMISSKIGRGERSNLTN